MALQFKDSWDEKSTEMRVSIISVLFLLVVFTIVAIYWALSTPKGVLFSDLEPQSAAGIVAGLDRLKVGYELRDGGTTVLVDQDIIHETRLKLMSGGVQLSGGVGFEIFDETEFGMTEFTQRINFQRALQGELSRTISALDEVKHARVHLVLPERGLFRKRQEPPTASVILFLKGDSAGLRAEQIIGIQRLVASSVPELEESMVTVLSEKGVTLSRSVVKNENIQMADLRLLRKKEIEGYLVEKVSNILKRSVGQNDTAVSLDVVLNFDKIKTTNETVVPNNDGSQNILRRQESRSEGEGQQSSKTRLINSEVEYKYGRIVEQVVKTPGSIKRLSIGVLITKEISPLKVKKIRDLIAVAIGIDAARGDKISVESIQQESYTSKDIISGHKNEEIYVDNISTVDKHEEKSTVPHMSTNKVTSDDPRPSNSLYDQLKGKLGSKNMSYLIIIVVAAIAIIMLIIISKRRATLRNTSLSQQLSDQERERVLKLLQEWLTSERVDKDKETQSI